VDKSQRLTIRNTASAGATWQFARADGKASWRVVDAPFPVGAVRQTEVENVAQRLRWISAQDIRSPLARAGNPAGLGLAPAKLELEVVVKEGDRDRILKLAVGNQVEGKNEYYLTTNESPFLMTWPAGMVTPFELDVQATLFDPLPPDAPKDGAPKDGGGK